MKKIAALLFILVALSSCTEEIRRNSPALQGWKDEVLWRAIDAKATLATNGSITITGLTQNETLTLKTSAANPGVYLLGQNDSRMASYLFSQDGNELLYTTGVNIGDGQIKIEEYDQTNMTISGTFRFNAVNVYNNPLGAETLNYQYGTFYKLPVIPELF
jgi:hypothetical protein